MKKTDIIEIAVKIFGIYLFIKLIGVLNDIITTITFVSVYDGNSLTHGADNDIIISVSIINFIIILTCAIFMTFGSKTITRKICNTKDFENSDMVFQNDKKTFIEIALCILGLLLISYSIPVFLSQLMTSPQTNNPAYYDIYNKPIIIGFLVRLIIGLVLIIFDKQIASWIVIDKKTNENK